MSSLEQLTTTNSDENKPILILGLGREGWSNFLFVSSINPDLPIVLADKKNLTDLDPKWQEMVDVIDHVQFINLNDKSSRYLLEENHFSLVLKTPGIPTEDLERKYHLQYQSVTTNTQLLFEWLKLNTNPDHITTVGVTGTKGKSTTTAVIRHVFETAGQPIVMGGNIGIPALDLLPAIQAELENMYKQSNIETANDFPTPLIVLLELSSHQLADLTISPEIAVIQAITPEHLDYYPDFETYLKAKEPICVFQTNEDLVLVNRESATATETANLSPGTIVSFARSMEADCYLDQETTVWFNDEPVFDTSLLKLPGGHNVLNIMPAIILAKLRHVPNDIISEALTTFSGLPHRLEFVTEVNGIRYYNDSLATNPQAAIAGLDSFADEPIILIAGGQNRNFDFGPLARHILNKKVTHLILFPETGKHILTNLNLLTDSLSLQNKLPTHTFVNSMEEAVKEAQKKAQPGSVVLLSPASPSFNLFKDYADRGNQFKKAVTNQ